MAKREIPSEKLWGGLQRIPWHDFVDSVQEQFLKGFCPKDCRIAGIGDVIFFLLSSCPGSMEYHIHHQQTILVLWACTHVLQHNFGIDICSKLGDDGHPALFVGSNLARASFKDLLEPLRRRVAKKTHHAAWQFSHETLKKIERFNPEIHGANSPQVTSVTMWTPSTVAFCLTVASWKAPPKCCYMAGHVT